jgi:5-methylcytosine-specific restriction endonuclease McrA
MAKKHRKQNRSKAHRIDRRIAEGRAKLDALIADYRRSQAKQPQTPDRVEQFKSEHPDLFDITPAKHFIPKHSRRRAEYEAYINSPEWRAFRMTIFAQRGRRCQNCGTEKGIIHVHHLNYNRFGHEKPKDVRVLCEECHTKEHQRLGGLASGAARKRRREKSA